MKKIAVFGSLKQGFYNHVRFGLGEPLTTAGVRGAMYLCYSYPHLKREEVAEPELVREHSVEIYEVDEEMYLNLVAMEVGAGYQEFKTEIEGDDGVMHNVTIFFSKDDLSMGEMPPLEEYSQATVPSAYVEDKLVAID